MMHIRSRRILAAVSAAALLFTSVPTGALAGETEYDEALLVMQEEEVPEESAELQETDIPGSPEESAELQETDIPGSPEESAGEVDVSLPEGDELSSDDQEVVEIEDLLVNEEAEDPEIMVVEDGIPEENEEQILSDEEEILEAADGAMTDPIEGYDPGLPAYFRELEEYWLTIPFPEGYEGWMVVKISGETGDGMESIYEETDQIVDDMVINIDTRGYQFIDVEIWFCEAGCEDQYFCEKHIPVLSDPSNLVKLTVAGGADETLTVPINQGFDVTLTAEQPIQAVCVDAGDHWWYDDRGRVFGPDNRMDARFDNGNLVMHDSSGGYGGSGTYRFYAQVQLEGSDEWITSNVIRITAEQYGEVGPFDFTLNTSTVVRGEFAEVTYDNADNADSYWVDIDKWNGSDWKRFDSRAHKDKAGTAYIATIDMEPGQYLLRAEAGGIAGYQGHSSDNERELTVQDSEIAEDIVYLDVNKKDLQTGENCYYSVFAPGASRVELFFDYENNEWWRDGADDDSMARSMNYRNSGTYKMVARAYYSDNEDDWRESDPVDISVNAPNGPLDAEFPDLPRFLTYGEDGLDFIFNRPANAEGMEVNVWYDPVGGDGGVSLLGINTNDDPSIGDAIHAVISKDEVAQAGEGNQVKVEMKAWAVGYEENRREWVIPLLKHADIEIVGITVSSDSAPVNQNVRIKVFPKQEGKKIAAVRFFDGNGFWENGRDITPDGQGWRFDSQGNFSVGHSWWSQGVYTIYAEVMLDDGPVWYTTEPVVVTVNQTGNVGEFAFSLDTPTVARGGIAKVTYGESQYADHYWVDIERINGSDREGYGSWAHTDTYGTAYIATAEFEPGTYEVRAKASGVGYEGRDADDGPVILTITDSGTAAGEILLNVSKQEPLTDEAIDYSVYAPGASRVELFFDYENNEWWRDGVDEDSMARDVCYRNSGTYKMVARAYYSGNEGDWRDSAPVEIRVSAPNGPLDAEFPDLPGTLIYGEDGLDFTFNRPANAEGMEVNVWYDPEDGEDRVPLLEINTNDDPSIGDAIHAVISKDEVAQAGEGNDVRVEIKAWGRGYEEARLDWTIPLLKRPDTGKVSIIIDTQTTPVNKDVKIRVTPANDGDRIEALKFWDDGGYWEWGKEITQENHEDWFDNNGNFEVWHSWDRSGKKTIYAEVLLENDNTWYYTEAKTVSVTSNGPAGSFSFTLDTNEAARGELVKVTYGESLNADHYWIDVDRWYEIDDEHDRAGWDWYGHYADSRSPGTVSFGTADMEPGRYLVRAGADGLGYERFEPDVEYELIITESAIEEGTVSLIVDKTDLKTREDYSFSVLAPGADWIEVAFDFDNTDNWACGWIDGNGGGESWTATRSYGSSGPYTLKARAHYPDGSWAESDPVTITVTSHKGVITVSLPDDLPTYLTTQNDFSFRAVMPENAEHLSVDVWHDTEDGSDGNLFNDWTDDEQYIDVTIRKEQLAAIGAGGIVRIAVSAEAYDYDGTRVECSIPVIDEPDADRLDIVAEPTEALVNEDVRITVSPKRAEDKIRAVRLFDGEGFWEESRPEWNGDQFDAAGNFSAWVSWWEPGAKRVFAQVTFDGNNWLNTDIVEINVRKNGDVGPFTCSIDKGSVVRGELAVATFTKADHADHYWIDIDKKCVDNETGHTWWERRSHKADRIGEPGSASFGTSDLEPGEYRIMGKAAGIGYEGCDAQNGYCYLTVTDSDTAEGNISVNVSKTQLDTAENFAVSVLAPGAKWVEVFYDYNGEGDWWNRSRFNGGDSFEGQNNYGHSGTYSIVAKAHYFETDAQGNPVNPDEHGNPTDEVTKTSEPVTMTVAASKGEALSITPPVLPAYLSEGDELRFTVQKPEQSDFVEVRVWYDPDDQETDGLLLEGWISEDSCVVTVPADKLAVVKDGKYVMVRVYANASGYDDAAAVEQIPVVPAVDTEKTVITASKTDPVVNEEITVTVSPKNVGATGKIKAVRFWGGMYYFHRGLDITPGENPDSFDADGNFVTGCPIEEPGTYSIFAKVTFDEVSRDGEDNRTWYTTDTIEVTVSSNGFVESVNFSLDKNRAKKDDTVLLTMEPAANVAEYWLEVEKWFEADEWHPEAYWEFVREYAVEIPADQLSGFPVPVRDMEAGDYRLRVWLYGGEGYQGCYANNGDYAELKIRDPWMTEEEEAAVEELKAIINSLPFTAGAANEEAVRRAKEILDSLNDVQKEYLGGDAAVQALASQVNGAQAQVDQAKADAVIAQINNLPEGAGLAQKAAIQAAAAAYAALTPAQKALVDANTAAKKKLKDAQDKVAAETVAAQLNALNANAGLADQAAVAAARKAYNSLTADQKKLVSAAALSKLTKAEASVKKAKAAAEEAKKEKITISKAPSGAKAKAEKKGKVTFTWKKFKQTKKTKPIWAKVKQIEVQYSTDKTFKTGVVSRKLGKKKTKLTVKKLKAKTTYYFRVRYVEGPLKVSKWSSVKKAKAKK